jgi:hypothetical protein
MKQDTNALTPECTIVYPDIFEPSSFKDGPENYRCVLLIDKDADISEMTQAIRAAADRKFSAKGDGFFNNLRKPIRDGNEKAIDEEGSIDMGSFYYEKYFISPKSKYQPEIVDIYGDPITDEAKIYGGCIVRCYLSFYGYEYLGNQGVGVMLRAVVLVDDGDPIGGGKVSASTVFASVLKEKKTLFEQGSDSSDVDIPY